MNGIPQRLGILLAAAALAAHAAAHGGETPSTPPASEVLVTVNGAALTRAAALRRLPTPAPDATPSAAEEREALDRVADLFVLRTLVDAATRTPVAPNDTSARPPAAATGEDATEEHPAPSRPRLTRTLLDQFQTEAHRDPRLGAAVEALLRPGPQRPPPPTERELKDAFERNRASLRLPDRAHVRQILVGTASNDTITARQDKCRHAEELRRRLERGGDFAALARAYSDCPSRAAGGDLGVLTRGQLQPALEKAVFAARGPALLPVVESPQGFHVMEVLERTPPGPLSFEEARPWLAQWRMAQRRQAALELRLRQLMERATIVYGGPEDPRIKR